MPNTVNEALVRDVIEDVLGRLGGSTTIVGSSLASASGAMCGTANGFAPGHGTPPYFLGPSSMRETPRWLFECIDHPMPNVSQTRANCCTCRMPPQ